LPFTQKNKLKLPFTPNLHAEQTACRTKYPCAGRRSCMVAFLNVLVRQYGP
jgi:hypothetical protein